jgi:hypothetical protein
MRGVQLIGALLQERPLIGPLGIALERCTRIVQGDGQLLGDDVQGLRAYVGHDGNAVGLSADAAGLAQFCLARTRLRCGAGRASGAGLDRDHRFGGGGQSRG